MTSQKKNPVRSTVGKRHKARRTDIALKIASERMRVTENGKLRDRTLLELVILSVRNKALQEGKSTAVNALLRLYKRLDPQCNDQEGGYLIVPAGMSADEWIADQLEKNRTRKSPAN